MSWFKLSFCGLQRCKVRGRTESSAPAEVRSAVLRTARRGRRALTFQQLGRLCANASCPIVRFGIGFCFNIPLCYERINVIEQHAELSSAHHSTMVPYQAAGFHRNNSMRKTLLPTSDPATPHRYSSNTPARQYRCINAVFA